MNNLEIIYIPIEQLKEYEHNARNHSEHDVNAIKTSIQQFGMNDPIGIWSDENIIVEGHGRLMACRQLGINEVPCIRLDHLSEEERRAYALAHNKTSELSNWNFDELEKELEKLQINMEQFGFEIFNENIDDFFTSDDKPQKEKKKIIICPHCGEEIEL